MADPGSVADRDSPARDGGATAGGVDRSDWSPSVDVAGDAVSLFAARALHDLLDAQTPLPDVGDELALLWHWLAFAPRARQAELGADGHPPTGAFLPPMSGRRRMHSGGFVQSTGHLRVGQPLYRTSTVTSVQRKQGRSGELTFVEVTSDIADEDARPLLSERVDLVYLPATNKRPAPAPAPGPASTWDVEVVVPMSTSMLFRFSALTYNAHRIHYDRNYAVDVEGYPALVVHGPLQALLLADLAASVGHTSTLHAFEFRAVAPAYDTAELVLRARDDGDNGVELGAFSAGVQTMQATATPSHPPPSGRVLRRG